MRWSACCGRPDSGRRRYAWKEYWNGLLRSSNISLFCAYPIDVFGEEFHVENVDALLCAHTHMVPIDDELESALNRAMNEVLGERVAGTPGADQGQPPALLGRGTQIRGHHPLASQ